MNLLPQTARGRLSLAIALSLLLHVVLVFGPKLVELEPAEPPLPPLLAKLEPLPKKVSKPVPRKPPPKKPPAPASSIAIHSAGPTVPDSTPEPAAVAEQPAQPETAPETTAPEQPAHPLPRQAQLAFTVYKGTDFPVGKARHRLVVDDDRHYSLQVNVMTVGIARLFKTFVLDQQSKGTLDAQGLHPDEFSEGRVNDDKDQKLTASFDWAGKTLRFSSGDSTALPEQAQDMLSFLYQLSQLPLDQPTVTLYISNGKKLERYQMEVGAEEDILTINGKMRALPLRKIHAPGEEGLEVWLGLEYRLLPVKIVQTDRKGEIAGQMVISDIRVSPD